MPAPVQSSVLLGEHWTMWRWVSMICKDSGWFWAYLCVIQWDRTETQNTCVCFLVFLHKKYSRKLVREMGGWIVQQWSFCLFQQALWVTDDLKELSPSRSILLTVAFSELSHRHSLRPLWTAARPRVRCQVQFVISADLPCWIGISPFKGEIWDFVNV